MWVNKKKDSSLCLCHFQIFIKRFLSQFLMAQIMNKNITNYNAETVIYEKNKM
jgi:hypothetical protein